MVPLMQSAAGSFWADYGSDIKTMIFFGGGILIYALIVNAFYQVISQRVMFSAKTVDGKRHVGGPGRGFLYLALFPVISLSFFLVISAALLFLGGSEKTPQEVFTLSMAIVAAIRVAAYFSEATSHDVAKMLPLGLLGVFLVNTDFSGLEQSFENMFTILDNLDLVAIFFAIVVFLEYTLRLLYVITQSFKSTKQVKLTMR